MKWLSYFSLALLSTSAICDDTPHYKIQIDPLMAAAGYANLQLDRSLSPTVSAGVMAWHLDKDSWGNSTEQSESSLGVRLDWFESGVFQRGWHSNAMVKVDLDGGQYARSRLKLTQSYQLVRGGVFINMGIGAQFVAESSNTTDSLYSGYQSWMLPAWEFSIGRAF